MDFWGVLRMEKFFFLKNLIRVMIYPWVSKVRFVGVFCDSDKMWQGSENEREKSDDGFYVM